MHLRDWMKLNNVTQQDLAGRMSPPVSQAKVSHWLQGARRVDLRSALQLLQLTDGQVSLEELAALCMQTANDLPDEAGLVQGARYAA